MKNLELFPLIEPAMREAGRTLLKFWPGKKAEGSTLEIREKSDGTFVTHADEASERVIISAIHRYFPEDAVYSEEQISNGKESHHHSAQYTWVVDPLDGTKSFIDGYNDFGMLVARIAQGDPKVGAMYFPARSLFAYAEEGKGAYVNGVKLYVSQATTVTPTQRIYLRHVKLNPQGVPPPWAYPTWMDSGMAFLSVANGDFDGFIIRMIHHQEWDVAAPLRVIKEAGGMITDGEGNPISIKCARVDYPYLIASNGKIHDELLDMVKKFPPQ